MSVNTESLAADLERIEAYLQGVTPGPWTKDPDWREGGADQVLDAAGHTVCFMATGRDEDEAEANLDFVTLARTDLPLLVAHCRELLAEVQRLEGGQ